MELPSIGTPGLWLGFTAFVLALLALDLGVFHRDPHEIRLREALGWSVVWVALALAFTGWVTWAFGRERGLEFLTGYLIEKALAVDNVFVFLVVFSTFAVPAAYLHRVLFWGILGALVMRAVFILLGAALLERFHWVMYLFGAFLVLTGVKLLLHRDAELHPERNPVFRLFTRLVPSVPSYHGPRFTVVHRGRRHATPLLLVLVCVELTDVVFAVDSIPAIFAVTKDPFIVYTSNIFAILGLRAMFFLLAGVVDRFYFLKEGLAVVLAFVGVKMLLADLAKIPIGVSLAVIAGVLAVAIGASWLRAALLARERRPVTRVGSAGEEALAPGPGEHGVEPGPIRAPERRPPRAQGL
jgi:tellurite resistance protein TerC